MKKLLLVGAALVGLLGAPGAHAVGVSTQGIPMVCPGIQNGVAQAPPDCLVTNPNVTTNKTQVDTYLPNGQNPQQVQMSPFQFSGAAALEIAANTASATSGAATLNTRGGRIASEALTTAAGASYTLTLTNSLFTTTSAVPQIVVASGTTTAGGPFAVTSVTMNAGSATIVIRNDGTAAVNGTLLIGFHI